MSSSVCLDHGNPLEPNEFTGEYECTECVRDKGREKLTVFTCLLVIVALFMVGCAQDYRTDYEKAQDTVLTEDQIDLRKWYDSQRLKAQQAEANEAAFREALRRCSTRRIVECL